MPTKAARHCTPRRPRGRGAAVAASAGVLVVSGLAGTGVLPLTDTGSPADAMVPRPDPVGEPGPGLDRPVRERALTLDRGEQQTNRPPAGPPLPRSSGTGRRIVYDISAQRVWLVRAGGDVARSYLVSGSRYDQVAPGTYPVFSTSRHAVSWHGTETMEYMVRFTRGDNANIGFHDIPVRAATGRAVQSLARLGTPLSDGCIRQRERDARALWKFAPVGTPVVVTA